MVQQRRGRAAAAAAEGCDHSEGLGDGSDEGLVVDGLESWQVQEALDALMAMDGNGDTLEAAAAAASGAS
jgi:hypothetical protein